MSDLVETKRDGRYDSIQASKIVNYLYNLLDEAGSTR